MSEAVVKSTQLVCTFCQRHFGTGGGEPNVILSKRLDNGTLENGDYKRLFPQAGKMVFFEVPVENNGKGKGNGPTSFNPKGVRESLVRRASIVFKLTNYVRYSMRTRTTRWVRRGMIGKTGKPAQISESEAFEGEGR